MGVSDIIKKIELKEKQDKQEFESLNLTAVIFEIYNKAIDNVNENYYRETLRELSKIRKGSSL